MDPNLTRSLARLAQRVKSLREWNLVVIDYAIIYGCVVVARRAPLCLHRRSVLHIILFSWGLSTLFLFFVFLSRLFCFFFGLFFFFGFSKAIGPPRELLASHRTLALVTAGEHFLSLPLHIWRAGLIWGHRSVLLCCCTLARESFCAEDLLGISVLITFLLPLFGISFSVISPEMCTHARSHGSGRADAEAPTRTSAAPHHTRAREPRGCGICPSPGSSPPQSIHLVMASWSIFLFAVTSRLSASTSADCTLYVAPIIWLIPLTLYGRWQLVGSLVSSLIPIDCFPCRNSQNYFWNLIYRHTTFFSVDSAVSISNAFVMRRKIL